MPPPQKPAMDHATPPTTLQPLPYHHALVTYLRHHEPEIWTWFASEKALEAHIERVRLDLLKATYRLERTHHADLYARAEHVATALGVENHEIEAAITLYQSQSGAALNAFLAYLPGEIHVVFDGPVLRTLEDREMDALLGHEIAHFGLLEGWDGEMQVADRILVAMAHDPEAVPAREESARLFQLYTEIFADRAGLQVTGDLDATVAMLVKMTTGLTEVSASSYLAQAEEIFRRERVQSAGLTHPESYIRARALQLWHERGPEAAADIGRVIEGSPTLDRLDLLAQERLARLTERLLRRFLAPRWFHTEAVLAHASQFFEDFEPEDVEVNVDVDVEAAGAAPPPRLGEELCRELSFEDQPLNDYLCYLLLDFVALAPELEDAPLAAAFEVADDLGLAERFSELAAKELKVLKRRLAKVRKNARQILKGLEAP